MENFIVVTQYVGPENGTDERRRIQITSTNDRSYVRLHWFQWESLRNFIKEQEDEKSKEVCAECSRIPEGYARGSHGEILCHSDDRNCYRQYVYNNYRCSWQLAYEADIRTT